jgi:hypothetical protein
MYFWPPAETVGAALRSVQPQREAFTIPVDRMIPQLRSAHTRTRVGRHM